MVRLPLHNEEGSGEVVAPKINTEASSLHQFIGICSAGCAKVYGMTIPCVNRPVAAKSHNTIYKLVGPFAFQ